MISDWLNPKLKIATQKSRKMTSQELKNRSKKFAIDIVWLTNELPHKAIGWNVSNQITRSATSVAANYRAVCRAKSDKDFISKMETVIEECDETQFWLELIEELTLVQSLNEVKRLWKEADELTSIFVSSVKTVKNRLNKS